jgi:hypothetical protein
VSGGHRVETWQLQGKEVEELLCRSDKTMMIIMCYDFQQYDHFAFEGKRLDFHATPLHSAAENQQQPNSGPVLSANKASPSTQGRKINHSMLHIFIYFTIKKRNSKPTQTMMLCNTMLCKIRHENMKNNTY